MKMTLSGWAFVVGFACLTTFGGEALEFTFKCPSPVVVDASLENTHPSDTGDFGADEDLINQAGYNFDYILYTTKLRRCGLFDGIIQQLGDLVDIGRPINKTEADHMAFVFSAMGDRSNEDDPRPFIFYAPKNLTYAIVDVLNKHGINFDKHVHELYADE